MSDEDGILPLINIVFLLLVFFLVAGRLENADPFPIDPPVSDSEGLPPGSSPLIQVGAEGRLALDGKVMDMDRLVARAAEHAGAAADAPLLRIKVDGRAEATLVVELLSRLDSAGVGRVALLTVPAG